MKYIVKNCPAFEQNSYKNRDWAIENACTDIDDRCCIKYNCVIKQVIEKCNYYQNKIGRTPQYRAGYIDATKDILELFELERIN